MKEKNYYFKMDKEAMYNNAMQLKREIKSLKEENERLKSQLLQNEFAKKNRLMQGMGGQPGGMTTSRASAIITSLKRRVKEAANENATLKNEVNQLKRNLKLTKQNEAEAINILLEKECSRLRSMLDAAIQEKNPKGISETEKELLEQKANCKELERVNEQLRYEVMKLKGSEKEALDRLYEYEAKEIKRIRQKAKKEKNKYTLKEAKVEIEKLILEKKQLEEQIEATKNKPIEPQDIKEDLLDTHKLEIEKLKAENLKFKSRIEEYRKRVFEKEKEARDVAREAKEKEEAYTLKGLEEKEKMTQGIIRLKLELSSKNKQITELENKSKEIIEPPNISSIVREVRNPLVEITDLVYVKYQFRLALIKSKKNLNELKEVLFSEYASDERISIKELTKIFKRQPLALADGEKLARYLIEPRRQQTVVYNKYNEKPIVDVRIQLDLFLDIDYPKDFSENVKSITETALRKIKPKFEDIRVKVQDVIEEKEVLDLATWLEITKQSFNELNSIEKDCILSLMVQDPDDLKELRFSVLLYHEL